MVLIGISGLSGSGKTVLAGRLVPLLPACESLSTDAYYRDLSAMAPPERAAINFDAPSALDGDLLVDHLERLAGGGTAPVPRYDFAAHARLAGASRIGPCESLVLEGLFALWHPAVRAMLDLAAFVDAPEETCLQRRIARDTAGRGRTEASVRAQWERDVLPMFRRHVLPLREGAGIVVDGTRPPEESAGRIVRRLRPAGRGPALPSLHSGE